jgi:uncharacterized protein YndB with AHSA1/START domain
MVNVNVSTIISRPVQEVFDFVSKPENDFQWQYGTLETARLFKSAIKSRTVFRSIGHFMGRRNLSTFEVAEYEQNKKYRIKSLSGPLHSQTSFTFETVNGGTQINISTQTNVVDFYQIHESLVEKILRKQLRENLALLKDLLETSQILPASENLDSSGESYLDSSKVVQ